MIITPTFALIGLLVLAGLVVLGYLIFAGSRDKRRYQEIPPGMRPAYSDDQLEKGVIERYMGWGLVLVAFFAIFFPIYWVQETSRIQEAEAGLFTSSVAEGEALYTENCAECHGSEARGGAAPHPYEEGQTWPAPNLRTVAERYEENPEVDDVRDLLITTLERGRPGTPMPEYGMAYQGPFTDQEIRAVVDWILVNQEEADEDGELPAPPADGEDNGEAEEDNGEADEDNGEADEENGENEEDAEDTAEADQATTDLSGEDLFAANCAQCHGPQAEGRVGPPLIGVFERHGREGATGIIRNGILVGTGTSMPPFQNGWFYGGRPFDDGELELLLDYLEELQPDELPEGAEQWQTPGVPPEDDEDDEDEDDDATTADGGARTGGL